MKPNVIFYLILIISLLLNACKKENKPMPPVAKKVPHEMTEHGNKRVDNYFWMNQRENPEVIAYLNAENTYTNAVMKHTEALQDKLYNEIKSKIKQDDQSVPFPDNNYYYYSRTVPEKEYSLYCRKKGSLSATEEIMLDVNAMAEGHSYFQVGGAEVSPDNKILAYSIDTVSRRNYTIFFKNLETGVILPDNIPLTSGQMVWANDNKTVFYGLKNDVTLRPEKIRKHVLGTPATDDKDVFFENDETFNVSVFKTKSKKFLMIASESTLTTEFRFLDASDPDGEFRILQTRTHGLEYSADHFGDYFFIRTNLDATNFRLMKTPVSKTAKENWKEVIGHRDDAYLSGFDLFKDFLVVSERSNGLNKLRVIPWSGGEQYYIPFEEEVYTTQPGDNAEMNTDVLRFVYTSLTTPASTYDFNMKTKERIFLKQTEVLGGFDKNNYETRREYATAGDGTKIPVTLVYKKGLQKNGQNPALLYGYGSYGITMDPTFRMTILPLLDRGFVYAIAQIRGEQFYGRKWYEDGKLLKKKNTFTDFNDCAKYLIDQGYTNPQKLFAKGGSAGGLLMGAVINLHPEYYRGVIANVPFVDVVTTMLDESIPLTTGEFDEWGNPKIKEYYDYMLSYSPYDNVEAKNYPALLVTTGLHDSQVQYFEPSKWVAKLRELKTDKNPLIFHINMEYGHGGASGRFKYIKDLALEYAFIFDLLGIN
jgi:oligopeptidase B